MLNDLAMEDSAAHSLLPLTNEQMRIAVEKGRNYRESPPAVGTGA